MQRAGNIVRPPCDSNRDGIVDTLDAVIITCAFGSYLGNQNGIHEQASSRAHRIVNVFNEMMASTRFGEEYAWGVSVQLR